MPLLHPRAFSVSLVSLTFAHAGLARGADTDTTTPPRIDLLEPSQTLSTLPQQFTAADLDGDGDQDLVHLPQGSSGEEGDPHAYWLENLGNRQFGPLRLIHLAPTAAGQALTGAKVWDLAGDSKPEIFVNRNSAPNSNLYYPLALTPGLDDEATAPIVPSFLASFTAGRPWDLVDLDGTGEPYLIKITGDSTSNQTTITLSRRNDTGSGAPFMPAFQTTSAYYSPFLVEFEGVDVDGDGDGDLCVASPDGKMRIYERKTPWDSSAEPRVVGLMYFGPGPKWIDLDGDGRKDMLNRDGTWMRNNGSWNFTPRAQSQASNLLVTAAVSKVIPRAGQPALVHAIVPTEDQTAYKRIIVPFDSMTLPAGEAVPVDPTTAPSFLHYGDLDGDGQMDLVYGHSAEESSYYGGRIIEVAWGSAAGFSAPQVLHAGASPAHHVFAADFNGDLLPDLVSGPDALGRFRIRYNAGVTGKPLGDGVIIEGLDIPGTALDIIGAARIDKDKYPDLVCSYIKIPVETEFPERAIVVVRGRKDGSFIKPVVPAGGLNFMPGPKVMDGGGMDNRNFVDWDRDGDLDLVVRGLWYVNKEGSFPDYPSFPTGKMPESLGDTIFIDDTITGDIDGDRWPDLISLVHGTDTLNPPPGKMLVGFNDGHGMIEDTLVLPFQPLAAHDFLGNPTLQGGAALADLNGDKRLDLWVRELSGTNHLGEPVTGEFCLLNPGRRKAREINNWRAAPSWTSEMKVTPGVAFGDFDGDRKATILAKSSGEWLSPWGYIRHGGGMPLASEPYDFTNGHIDLTKIVFTGGADIDGDHDTDFILGGGNFPLVLLYNPNAEAGKRKPVKAKAVEWLGSLPVVR